MKWTRRGSSVAMTILGDPAMLCSWGADLRWKKSYVVYEVVLPTTVCLMMCGVNKIRQLDSTNVYKSLHEYFRPIARKFDGVPLDSGT